MNKPKIIIFASGTKEGGGSGFENLVIKSKTIPSPEKYPNEAILNAEIVAVVSNHEHGGVRKKADSLGIKFIHFDKDFTAENYQKIVKDTGAEWIILSGWLKKVAGLPVDKTININPGPLPEVGGKGMYGINVHKRVLDDWRGGISYSDCPVGHSQVTLHFVDENFDTGKILYKRNVKLPPLFDLTAETIQHEVNAKEQLIQPYVTDLVIQGNITLLNNEVKIDFRVAMYTLMLGVLEKNQISKEDFDLNFIETRITQNKK